ncbi:hypothetical protein M514_08700 [Trichuris suis]|uniref:GIY-YIG domain-containing protein n=1 Tax=Trichuris suis TaxID=68888 RepID=A0A085MYR3_9BILA|nr:hypothetical protein M514_08700 [Trichuris suis]
MTSTGVNTIAFALSPWQRLRGEPEAEHMAALEADRTNLRTAAYHPVLRRLRGKIKRVGSKLGFNVRTSVPFFVMTNKKVPLHQCPGIVYEIKCKCSTSYIGEAGNTLALRYQEHMKALTRYRNAVNRLNIPTHYEDAPDTRAT